MSAREVHVATMSRASHDAVYETLVDALSHLDWAGRRQARYFRLLSLEGPDDPLGVGSVFSSTGSIPGSRRRFHDSSTVTITDRPSVFEFVTEATVPGRNTMEATYRHRYEMEPTRDGCSIRYTLRQERVVHPMLRMRVPIVRDVVWKFGLPMMLGRGLRNLARAAEGHVANEERTDAA